MGEETKWAGKTFASGTKTWAHNTRSEMSNAHSHVKDDNVSPGNAVGTFFSNRAHESTSIIKQTAHRAHHVAGEVKQKDHHRTCLLLRLSNR